MKFLAYACWTSLNFADIIICMKKLNLKTFGIILIWLVIATAILYFTPFKKIIPRSSNNIDDASNYVNAKLTSGSYEYDFGAVSMANGKVRHSYQLKNEGTEVLAINKVWTSCMCTNAEIKLSDGKIYGPFGMSGGHGGDTATDIDIPSGEEFELIAEFDPNAHGPDATGPIQRSVFIKTSAAKEPLGLSFTANVVK